MRTWLINQSGQTRFKHAYSELLLLRLGKFMNKGDVCRHSNWAPSSEFVSSSIPPWQIVTAHAQPFRGARDLAFCLTVPLDSLLVWASTGGSGENARMRRLASTFAARICYKYQIRLTRPQWPISYFFFFFLIIVNNVVKRSTINYYNLRL